MLKNLRFERRGVKFDKARMDCGSYARDIVEVVSKHCDTFYIRAMMSELLRKRIHNLPDDAWKETMIQTFNRRGCELRLIRSTPFFNYVSLLADSGN